MVRDAALNGGGGWLTASVSATALLASAVSLWESTIKQPDIKVYVTENLSYTRDPYGSYEVVAVPITIQNGGARDAAVISLTLDVKNPATGQSDRFISAFSADAQYFGARDDVAARIKRPKMPFAPLSIAGRSAYTGTILFYPPDYKEQKLLEPKSKVEMTLNLAMPAPSGWIDRMLTSLPEPIAIKAEVPNYLPGALLSGDMARLKVTLN
jgi:hypothetical protein